MAFLFFIVILLALWIGRLHLRVYELQERETRREESLARLRERVAQLAGKAPALQPAQPAGAAEIVKAEAPAAAPAPPPVPAVHAAPAAKAGPPPVPVTPPLTVTPPAPVRASSAEHIATPSATPRPAAAPPQPPAIPVAPPAWTIAQPPGRVPPPPGRPVEPPPPPPEGARFDWEALIGVKLFSWIAGIGFALGGIFFLGYSIQNGWLQPPVRMAIGFATGVGLLIACELKAARRYPVTANALDGAAIAILFSTAFASYRLWSLYGPVTAFGLLALVTVVAVLLSIRRDSVFIALLGLVGGFSTPALLSTGQDNPIGLFGYLLLLNAGLAWVAYRKRWVVLIALSLAFTTIYQWGWVVTFLSASKLQTAAAIFLVFPILGSVSFALAGRGASTDPAALERREWFRQLVGLNAALPLLFALFMAMMPEYGEHAALLFGFLLCLDAGLFAIALWRGPSLLHVLGALATALVFLAWCVSSYPHVQHNANFPQVLGFVALFVVFFLATGLTARHGRRRLEGPGRLAVYAAPILLFTFPVLARLEPEFGPPALPFSVLFVLLGGIAAFAIAEDAGLLHFIAAFFALAAEAVWSAGYLTEERLLPALAIYALFGLFYLGVPLLARRLDRILRPEGLGGALLLASILLLFFLSVGPVAPSSLWGLALLLGLLNGALLIEGRATRHPILAISGTVLSWIVLATWWASGALSSHLVPALCVMAGFTLLTLGGHIWMGTGSDADAGAAQAGSGLALVGHLFLFFVASQPSLSLPPWPMLGILGLLDLAVGASALYTRRADLHMAAVVLSQLILMVWIGMTDSPSWAIVGMTSAAAIAAFSLAWSALARRRVAAGEARDRFDMAAAGAALLGQVALIVASRPPLETLGVGVLMPFHVGFLGCLLALAAIRRWQVLAVASVVPTWVATWLWQAAHPGAPFWWDNLVFAAPVYLLFLAYPLALGRRAERSPEAHLAAVLASASFFHVGRLSLIAAGWQDVIGVLPVVQAALMSVLLIGLLRIERPGERTLGRLALVAGTVLAFITVAIPLQFDKEWITIGWALEGAALAWLFRRIPHRGLFWWALGLLAAVFVRLALNPEVLVYQPRSEARILNWYLYTYLICGGAMMVAGWMFSKTEDSILGLLRGSQLAPAGGTILLFLLLNIEIADFYATGSTITFNLSAGLAQDLTYTLGWAVFAVCLLSAGILLRSHGARLSAIVLLTVTVLKGFLHDMARLGGLYRVMSFIGLAICLSLVAVVLQRFVLAPRASGATKR